MIVEVGKCPEFVEELAQATDEQVTKRNGNGTNGTSKRSGRSRRASAKAQKYDATDYLPDDAGEMDENAEFSPENATADFNEESMAVADFATRLSSKDKRMLSYAASRNATLVLKNVSKEQMKDFALIGVDADTAIIKNADQGKRQEIILIGANNADLITDDDYEAEGQVDKRYASETVMRARKYAEIATAQPSSDEERAQQLAALEDTENGEVTTSELSDMQIAERVQMYVKDQTFRDNDRQAGRLQGFSGLENVSKAEAQATVIIDAVTWYPNQIKIFNTTFNGPKAQYWGSFDIKVYATNSPRRKFVKISSVGTGASMEKVNTNNSKTRGFFTSYGRISFYPGTKDQPKMPAGWRRIHLEPKSPNSETSYNFTTGWEVGGSADAGFSGKTPSGSVGLSASYNSSKSQAYVIPDFRARNRSNGTKCEWKYEFSAYHQNWMELCYTGGDWASPDVNPLPPLCSDALNMLAEAVYEAPASENSVIPFHFNIGHYAGKLISESTSIFSWKKRRRSRGHHAWQTVYINLGAVRHP